MKTIWPTHPGYRPAPPLVGLGREHDMLVARITGKLRYEQFIQIHWDEAGILERQQKRFDRKAEADS